ncbi:MAG TPA: 3-phosphoshikimate 1-carboxyvinyltransferase [Deltaproteobacteria bacterium]|jgi:3-phosphoshikimate 1-carboxyvinyltransferase|nr:3-phosphoshikimate 1-carboxyvinyltransferase [Deltaproteobacteria bacterium]HOI08103.1 3-phosphoshikimate 1-carboxyvinyltransferase [Deltaproteobacteria bacterium]
MNIRGELRVPGDKSISHRAFMLGSLARGSTTVSGALGSKDVASTRRVLEALGARIEEKGGTWLVTGGDLREPSTVLDAGNSGTTARLVSGICAAIEGVSVMTGDSSLVTRPMGRVMRPLGKMGAQFLARQDRHLPMAVRGGRLTGISYGMDVASAQVKSAIILAGLKAEGSTEVTEPFPSRDHSERMLSYFGATLARGGNSVGLEGPQELEAREVSVPGDPSSAAFPAVWAAATPGSEALIREVCLNPTRIGFIPVLKRMGAVITLENVREVCGEPVGDILVRGAVLQGTIIEGEEIPKLIDEIPILAVAACLAEGRTVVRDASELRVKETDRIKALVEGLASLGAGAEETPDGLVIEGPLKLERGSVRTYSDHRIAMSFHILSRAAGIDVAIDDPGCVDISFPGFFELMETLA